MGFFVKKTLKLYLVPYFLPKKVIFIFFVRLPDPSKMVMRPKNNFTPLFWKILFFSKKLFNKNYSKHRRLQKRLYGFLSPDAPLPSKRSYSPTN